MSDFRFFSSLSTHRTWEDWCGMLLGALIMLSPWFPTQAGHEVVDAERSFVILNTFTVGILVFGLAQLVARFN
jgi:predicted phage tail protein